MTRIKATKDRPKYVPLSVSVTAEQSDEITRLAIEHGYSSRSEYVRACCLGTVAAAGKRGVK